MGIHQSTKNQYFLCDHCNKTINNPFNIFSDHISTCFLSAPIAKRQGLRIQSFKSLCRMIKVSWSTTQSVSLAIDRKTILEDSLDQIFNLSSEQLRTEFNITFKNENASDAGGLTKDFLISLISFITSCDLHLLEPIHSKSKVYKLTKSTDLAQIYIFLGKVIGKCLLEDIPIPIKLNRLLLEQIQSDRRSYDLDDLKKIDFELWESLQSLHDKQIGNSYLYFAVPNGDTTEELIPNGASIEVTDENKQIFTTLYAQYECYDSIQLALKSLKSGIFEVIPEHLFMILHPEDLDLLISGTDTIDILQWKTHTEYKLPFRSDHPIIEWFWQILRTLSQKQLQQLLFYTTGTESLPFGGFAALKTVRGEPCMFTIIPLEYNPGAFIQAHTCFNRLEIPVYPTYELLKSEIEYLANANNEFFKEL